MKENWDNYEYFIWSIFLHFSFRITAYHYVDPFVSILIISLIAFLFLFFFISFCVIFSSLCCVSVFSLFFILYFVPIIVFVFSLHYFPPSSASLLFFFLLSLQFSCFLLSIFPIFCNHCIFYGVCFEIFIFCDKWLLWQNSIICILLIFFSPSFYELAPLWLQKGCDSIRATGEGVSRSEICHLPGSVWAVVPPSLNPLWSSIFI